MVRILGESKNMEKVSKDVYVAGAFAILAAIIGAWFGNVFGQETAKTELEALKGKYAELQKEYVKLENEYQNLLMNIEVQGEIGNENVMTGATEEIKSEEITNSVVEADTSNTITLFELGYFSKGKAEEVTYIKDVFGNEYTHAFRIATTVVKEEYMFDHDYVTEFFLNKEYNKFSCKVFFPEDAYGTEQHRLLIWGDGEQLEVVIVEKKSGLQSIEIDVRNVDYLQFATVTEERHSGSALGIIEPYLEK